jgi:hypothetical protein
LVSVDIIVREEINMQKDFWTKGIVLGCAFMLIFLVTNVSTAIRNTNETHDIIPSRLFGLHSYIAVTYNASQTSEPLEPNGPPRVITLDVIYQVYRVILGQFILWYYNFTQQKINVTLEIIEKPDYCTANIDNSTLWFPISNTLSVKQTALTVSVNENAPAFQLSRVAIRASVNDKLGPFGFFTFINGIETIIHVSFINGYLPLINVTPENDFIETTPGTTVVDPITVENLGNGITLVNIEVISHPMDWSINIASSIIISVNESKVTNLFVCPPLDFCGTGIIILSFTPEYLGNPQYHGDPTIVYITVEVSP